MPSIRGDARAGRARSPGGVFSYLQGECVSRFEIEGSTSAVEIYFGLGSLLASAVPSDSKGLNYRAVLDDRRWSPNLAPYPQTAGKYCPGLLLVVSGPAITGLGKPVIPLLPVVCCSASSGFSSIGGGRAKAVCRVPVGGRRYRKRFVVRS
jgi:hypothetical protein